MKDRLFIVPHTHYEGAVFKTRAEYLDMGFPHILEALRTLRDEPDYRFVLDQTAFIKPFLERYPEQAATLEEMVRAGRLEITCGMDVMADVNLPCGESFVRQVLYGKRFALERLGVEVTVGWALDTFGQHPQIPQLLRLAGFTAHFFSRGVPEPDAPSEFLWEGLDGTAILACWQPFMYGLFKPLPPNDLEFAEMAEQTLRKLRRHARHPVLVALSGTDMGEPDPDLPARVRAFNAGQHEVELVIATPEEFLAALGDPATLPRKRYDLNPVFPGCYTSRIKVKQANRRLEGTLLNCETLEAIERWGGGPTARDDLLDLWEPVLFNQVHDIMCGVQTDHVYADTMGAYDAVRRAAEPRLERGLAALAARVDTRGPGIPLLVVNPLAWERRDLAEAEVGFSEPAVRSVGLVDHTGAPVPCQILEVERFARDGGIKWARLAWMAEVPSLGYRLYHAVPDAEPGPATDVDSNLAGRRFREAYSVEVMAGRIENAYFRLTCDLWSGAITSLVDKRSGHELLDTSLFPGIVVTREQDHGDPWEPNSILKGGISRASERLVPPPTPATADLSSNYNGEGAVRHGPVLASFTIGHPFGSGAFGLEVRLYAGLPRIDLRVDLVNQERFVRYRAAVPTTLRGGRMVQEIPFGAVERGPGEFPAQTWADLSDGERGLAILNRGLPGNEVRDNLMLLSLLRAVKLLKYVVHGGYEEGVPWETGFELGVHHTFEFALVPHRGDWREADLARAGAGYNRPLLVHKATPHPGPLPRAASLLRVSHPAALVTAFKVGSEGDLVVRLYESSGRPAPGVALEFARPLGRAEEADLLERSLRPAAVQERRLLADLRPWEIKTFRVAPLPL